jgi:hypothetical protein
MLIDTNVNLGCWPFTFTPDRTAAQLVKHLAASGIDRALVSHFGATFQPDPMPSNRTLLAAVKRTPALVPIGAINSPNVRRRKFVLSNCCPISTTTGSPIPW